MRENRETVEGMGFESSFSLFAGGRGVEGKLHVVSCYAPIRAASREVKNAFY